MKDAGVVQDSLQTGNTDHDPGPGEFFPQSMIVFLQSTMLQLLHGCLVGSSSGGGHCCEVDSSDKVLKDARRVGMTGHSVEMRALGTKGTPDLTVHTNTNTHTCASTRD
jgi:hypothetical protein